MKVVSCALTVSCLWVAAACAQDNQGVQIERVGVADGLYMLQGPGGNVGVSVGDDGVFIIDDQMPPLTQQIQAAIAQISDAPVRMVVNTHWHYDHTGGNEIFAEAGAIIIAHDTVRARMGTAHTSARTGRTRPPSPEAALPVISFADSVSFHLNGETVRAFHVPPAHTDGDVVLLLERSNVAHMGDTFFNGRYPVIDINAGGSVRGMIGAIDEVLPRLNTETILIPGHGPLADVEKLIRFQVMMKTVADRVQAMIDQGRSVDEIIAARPTNEFDPDWSWRNMSPERWVRLVYDSLVADQANRDTG